MVQGKGLMEEAKEIIVSESLKKKVIKGVEWSFADNIASSGITFLIGLVLARLLLPEEFGIVGMITIFIAISNSIVDCGFSNALIRKTNADNTDYNTVFYFNLLVGFLLYTVLYICAPFIAYFFNEPLLISVTRILGVVLIVDSLSIIQRTIFIKRIDFKTQTKISLISSILSGFIGITMALVGCGVWSLIGQQISRQFLSTFFLWFYNKWRPALEFSTKSFSELFGFGSKLLASGLLDTIYKNMYYIVIGRFYHASLLGQYTRAEQFSLIFSSNLTSVIQRVSYPVLSSIQDDAERLKEAYRKIIKVTMLIAFACMVGLAAVAKPLILVLIGDAWLEAVPFLQIICFSVMLYPLHAINLNILQVKGRSDLFLKLEIIKKIIGVFPIALGILWGIKIMLWGGVVTSVISYFFNSYYSSFLIDYPTKNQLKDIFPTFIISLFIGLLMWGITFFDMSIYIMLPLQCIVGTLLMIVIYEKLKFYEYLEIKNILTLNQKKYGK